MNEKLLKELNRFIYNYNQITTNLIYDGRDIYKNGFEIKPDYTNSTKLIDIVTKFNEQYQNFKKDFEKLPKINLAKKINYREFSTYDNNKLLVLDLYNVNEGLYNEDGWIALQLYFLNSKLFANLFNEEYHNNTYQERININPKIIKDYLDVFDKHQKLLEIYEKLRRAFLFGNGKTILFSNIDGELLNGLKNFTFTFGNGYMNGHEYIKVTFKLDEQLEIINYELEFDTFNENYKEHEQEIINYLLDNIYINNSELPKLETKEVEKSYTKNYNNLK